MNKNQDAISAYGEYRQHIGLGHGVVDMPPGYENIKKYIGSLAHKFNHDFYNWNCDMTYVS